MVTGKVYQVITAVASGIGSLSLGLLYVWPSYTIPMLAASNGTILSAPLSLSEEAMLGSLPSLGAVVGSAIVAMLIDTFGRKGGTIIVTVFYIISWLMVGFTQSIIVVLIARFVGGVAGGATSVITPVYISEITEDQIRGTLATVVVLFYSIGTLISYFIGWYCSYHVIVWINLAIAVFRFVMLFFIPESPVYLMNKKRVEDARISMGKYRGVSPSSIIVQQELSRIKQELQSPVSLDSINEIGEEAEKKKLTSDEYKDEVKPKFAACKTLCKSAASRRAFIIVFIAFTMEILMGIAPVTVYANQVFVSADPEKGDLYSVVLAVVWCSGALLSGVFADKIGRRMMLISSSVLVSVCLVTLGALLQTKSAPAWVSILIIMVYVFCFMFGVGPIPYVLMSEIFCPEVQTLASMIIIEWLWLSAFFVIGVFHWMNSVIGIHSTFYIFAFNSALNVAFAYFMVPETKGLSNKEIQLVLSKKRVIL